MTLQLYLNNATLLFFLFFNVFGWLNSFGKNYRLLTAGSLRLRVGVGVGQFLPTPSPTPTPTKTVDSDRLQLRSQLRLRSPGRKEGSVLDVKKVTTPLAWRACRHSWCMEDEGDTMQGRRSCRSILQHIMPITATFITHPAKRGGRFCLPSRIFSIAQRRRQISTRNFQYLIQHQYVFVIQNFGKKIRN